MVVTVLSRFCYVLYWFRMGFIEGRRPLAVPHLLSKIKAANIMPTNRGDRFLHGVEVSLRGLCPQAAKGADRPGRLTCIPCHPERGFDFAPSAKSNRSRRIPCSPPLPQAHQGILGVLEPRGDRHGSFSGSMLPSGEVQGNYRSLFLFVNGSIVWLIKPSETCSPSKP